MYQMDVSENNVWKIQTKNSVTKEGTLAEVYSYMVKDLQFNPVEVDAALTEMQHHNHMSAHFGVMRRFIFTMNPDISELN